MDEAYQVIQYLKQERKTLATAESCTGGLLGKLLTDVPGASAVYLGGVISYAYEVKERLLGVDHGILQTQGAVCTTVVCQMAEGARSCFNADVALAITGNAGPGTDAINQNLGEIYIACADSYGTRSVKLQLSGNRESNREAACLAALKMLLE